MSIACSHSRIWLQKTVHCWIQTSCRPVSTSSAINRGLRATKQADGARGAGRDRYRRVRNDYRTRKDVPQFKIKKFTSDHPGGAEFWDNERKVSFKSTAERGIRRVNKTAEASKDDIRERDRVIPDVRDRILHGGNAASRNPRGGRDRSVKGTAGGSSQDLRKATVTKPSYAAGRDTHRDPKDDQGQVNGVSNAIQSDESDQSPAKRQNWQREKAELHRILLQLDRLQKRVQNNEIMRLTSFSTSSKRRPSAELQDTILSLTGKINRKVQSGEWTRRNVRAALNDRPIKMHFWNAPPVGKSGLWFDYENARLELVVNGETKGQHGDAQGVGDEASTHESEISSSASRESEKMFTIDPPRSTHQKQQQDNVNDDHMPVSIPYTTAASAFLYGTNTVLASLKAHRRKFYTLYLSTRFSDPSLTDTQTITQLAQKAQIPIRYATSSKLLDKMSENRPHNGIVLEASKLPAPPILSLGEPDITTTNTYTKIPIHLAPQSPEDQSINGTLTTIPSLQLEGRNPLILMLDGITDPGNIGSILRTAYFYSVDAVAVATNTCANLNSAALAKASSGACEAVPIFGLPRPAGFVYECKRAGWKVYAAVAPPAAVDAGSDWEQMLRKWKSNIRTLTTTTTLATNSPLTKHPSILILGAEGEGLREGLKKRADYFVTIEGGRRRSRHREDADIGVDSLNVSVAASVLLEAFTKVVPESVAGAE